MPKLCLMVYTKGDECFEYSIDFEEYDERSIFEMLDDEIGLDSICDIDIWLESEVKSSACRKLY